MTDVPIEIRDLAHKIGTFSVVPFIGAGCSKLLLAGNDWNGITDATATKLGLSTWTGLSPTDVAEQFVGSFGHDALCDFLRPRLTVTEFKDAFGTSHLAMMAMNFTVMYTTNVDNVFELAFEKYGRALTTVAVLGDLHTVTPGKAVLYKYHGCLSQPSSLVWTSSDYTKRRADRDFFINVRLRSDLLTKTLLFIGYSLKDPHIIELLKSMQALYADGVRKSIVIAVGDADAFRKALINEGLDLEVIAPAELFPGVDPKLALERFLNETAAEVYRNFMQSQLVDMFTPTTPQRYVVLAEYELALLEQACESHTLEKAIKLFRSKVDQCTIPQDFRDRVSELAAKLISRAHDEPFNSADLGGLVTNLHLPPLHKLMVQSYACTLCAKEIDDMFSFLIDLPDDVSAKFMVACEAAKLLKASNIPVHERFADWVAGPLRLDKNDFESLTPEQQAYVKPIFDSIFSKSQRENPLTRTSIRFAGRRTKTQMIEHMMKSLPHKVRQPDDPQ